MGTLVIPPEFLTITYNGKQTPDSTLSMFEHGANCQLFAYSLLAHFGVSIPSFRSSNLWEDETFTEKVDDPQAFDIMLFHKTPESWGAHVGLCIGEQKIIHLSKEVGVPEIKEYNRMGESDMYKYYIGCKRVKNT